MCLTIHEFHVIIDQPMAWPAIEQAICRICDVIDGYELW